VTWDLKIVGGRLVDGTSAPAFDGSVAIEDGRFVEVGRWQAAQDYRATVVSGVVTLMNDRLTGAHPGRVIRAGHCGNEEPPGPLRLPHQARQFADAGEPKEPIGRIRDLF
jgi:N-acyl-D-aspartate/D-glutamate deacylase